MNRLLRLLSVRSRSARATVHTPAGNIATSIFRPLEALEPRVLMSATADPGDTLATARDLGTLGASAHVTGSVGGTDTGDFYAFSVARATNLTVTISGLSHDAEIDLVQDANDNGVVDAGEIIATATNGTARTATLTAPINGGSYFIHVVPGSASKTSYSLKLVNVPQPSGITGDVYEPDNTAAQASTIIPNATPQSHSLDTTADVDWAKFTIATATGVTVQTGGSHGDTELQLFTAADTTDPILTDDNSGAGSFSRINTNLVPGTYFVKVSDAGATSVSHYTLSVRTHTAVTPSHAVLASLARPLGVLIGNRQVSGQLGGAANNLADLYSFSVVQPIVLSVQVTTPILGWKLSIFDANGNRVDPDVSSHFITGGNAGTEVFSLDTGNYSLVIQQPVPLISTFGQNTVQAAGTAGVPSNVGFPGSDIPPSGIFINLPNFGAVIAGSALFDTLEPAGIPGNPSHPLPAQPYTISLSALLPSEVGLFTPGV